MAYLRVFNQGKQDRVELSDESVVLGRSPGCRVVLSTPAASRFHAKVVRAGSEYVIEDLNSLNGTYVNGQQISQPTRLRSHDIIRIGDCELTFHAIEEADIALTRVEMVPPEQEDRFQIITTHRLADADTSNTELRPATKLSAILELTKNLGNALQIDLLLPRMLESLFKLLPQADRGVVLLLDEGARKLVPKAVKARYDPGDRSLRLSRTIVNQVLANGCAILSADASKEALLANQSVAEMGIRSLICVPLLNHDETPFGVIEVHSEDVTRKFTDADLELLVAVGRTAALAIDNARMHERLLKEDRQQRDLEVARDVQNSFLPQAAPEFPGYAFYSFYRAASSVGGDYYDFIRMREDRLAIAVGDMGDKGIAAALLMARLARELLLATLTGDSAPVAVQKIQRAIPIAAKDAKMATFQLLYLDGKQHTLTLVNAGHPPPLLRHANGAVGLLGEPAGLPVFSAKAGSAPTPETVTVALEPGAAVLLYTNGVIDARNRVQEALGPQRLMEFFRAASKDPIETGKAVMEEVRRFASGCAQTEDMTLVCLGRGARS